MKGLVVNGFTVVETLGSGHGGLLYLARNESTGREAVIRVARTGEDSLSVRVFVEEAQRLLPEANAAETVVTRDGTTVLMAVGAPPAVAPGSGATEHPTTERLPRLDSSQAVTARLPQEPQPSRSRWPVLVLSMLLVVATSAVVVLVLTRSSPPPPVVVVAPEPPAPPPGPMPPPCAFDGARRRELDRAVDRLDALALAVESPASEEFEAARTAVRDELAALTPGSACVSLPPKLTALASAWERRLAPHRCAVDDTWRAAVTAALEQVDADAPPRRPIDATGCPPPQVLPEPKKPAAPAPRLNCEPNREWKRLMLNNLAALEATADGLTAVEMAAESDRVGRIIDEAETYEQCLRAIKQFDALRRRAIK